MIINSHAFLGCVGETRSQASSLVSLKSIREAIAPVGPSQVQGGLELEGTIDAERVGRDAAVHYGEQRSGDGASPGNLLAKLQDLGWNRINHLWQLPVEHVEKVLVAHLPKSCLYICLLHEEP